MSFEIVITSEMIQYSLIITGAIAFGYELIDKFYDVKITRRV